VTTEEVMQCLQDGLTYGAAVLAVPMKATVKESVDGNDDDDDNDGDDSDVDDDDDDDDDDYG